MAEAKTRQKARLSSLLGAVDGSRDYLVGLLSRMVAVPTINPPGQNYGKFCELMGDELSAVGVNDIQPVTVPKERLTAQLPQYAEHERTNLIAHFRQGDYPTLHLNCHIDVVPPTSGWSRDPFNAEIEGDKLYGRGSADMKGIGAAMVTAVRSLISLPEKPRVNLALSFTADEETGGELGAGFLAERGMILGDFAIVEGLDGDYLTVANKGVIWAGLSFRGKPAHASIPHRGKNAFLAGMDCARRLKSLFGKLRAERTAYSTQEARQTYTTINIGGVAEGGSKVNTVPDHFSFTVDVRTIPEMSKEKVLDTLSEAISGAEKANPGVKGRMEIIQDAEAVLGDEGGRWLPLLDRAYRLATGRKPKHCLAPFYTDMRHIVGGAGVPALGLGCEVGGVHGDDEWVSISGLVDIAKVVAVVAELMAEG